MQILFPSDYFNEDKPDEMYSDQESEFKKKGYQTAAINIDEIKPNSKLIPPPTEECVILYRGWMMDIKEYQTLNSAISKYKCTPFTTLEEYKLTHHLPNWYELIKELTPETVVFSVDDDLSRN